MNSPQIILLFIGEILAVYFLSHLVLKKSYRFLMRIGGRRMIVGMLSLVYLPGTIIHELSHYIAALLLGMHPYDVNIFPVIEAHKVRLGHVMYEKNKGDILRPILVGIAPFFGAMTVLLLVVYSGMFPGKALWQTVIFGYLILTITANMFSSAQDLVDIGYLIPPVIIICLLLYLFPVSIAPHYTEPIQNALLYFIYTVQNPLLFSIVFHAILVLVLSRLE